MTEWELIEQLKLKNNGAFKIIVDTWQNLVYNTVLGFVQNEEDAEDVSQEVFIQVYESIKNFKGDSKFSTWIYRISVSKSLDHLRKKKRKSALLLLKAFLVKMTN
ncbi:MAG: sigma-70 family RNA polymerase sigma factor [Chitinophagaceae bacterium]